MRAASPGANVGGVRIANRCRVGTQTLPESEPAKTLLRDDKAASAARFAAFKS
jgi:hypothetical protein